MKHYYTSFKKCHKEKYFQQLRLATLIACFSITGGYAKAYSSGTGSHPFPFTDVVDVKLMVAESHNIIIEEQQTVSGTVTDVQRNPLPGVTVMVKGTNTGTVTNTQGEFSIEAEEEDILVFSFIGFTTQEVAIQGRTTIDISLKEDVAQLKEVVVIGYGTQRKEDITGAISSVKTEDIRTQGSHTVEKALQGRVAGVQVESSGGNPGSGVRILIRGTGSLGNNAPLYIVDGVQVDNINNLPPTDIASMEVLKDASAAAIYGSRAANGVVLITTKSGEEGETRIQFDTYAGVQKIGNRIELLNASEWARVSNAAHDAAELDRLEIAQNPESLGAGTDWQDQIYRTAPMQNYNLSASGGGEAYTYSLSGGYFSQDGIVKETDYERLNLRIKSDFTKGRIKIGESIILSKSFSQLLTGGLNASQGGNPVGSSLKMIPVFEVYDPTAVGGFAGAYGPVVNVANPLAQVHLSRPRNEVTRTMANAYAEVSLFEGLKYKLNLGYTNTFGFNNNYTFPYEIGTLFLNEDADLYESRNESRFFMQEHTLNYNETFEKHNIQALVGYTFQKNQFRGLYGSKSGMPAGIRVLDAGVDRVNSGSNAWESTLLSYLGRLVYGYDSRYIMTATFRRDGSSRFSEKNRYGNFPSVAIAWNASNEAFFEPLESVMSTLKIRGSYGKLGNQEFANYSYTPAITLNTNSVIGQDQHLWPGAIQTAFATPDIRWETSETYNVGADMGFLKDRLTLSADYFVKTNSDILLRVPIPLSTGSTSSPFVNAGQITNKGFEAALSYRQVVNNDFNYQFTGTISSVKNEVDHLGTGAQQIFGGIPTHFGSSAPSTLTQAGYPVGAFFLIKTDGIFNSTEEVEAHSKDGELIQPKAKPGDVRFVDFNDDGKIDQNDRQYLGDPTPDFSFGFGSDVSWKGFDLSLFFQGTVGNEIYNGIRQDLEGMNLNFNYSKTTLNAWTPDRQTDFPRAVINDPNFNAQTSDRFLEDGSYLRLRTLQLGYSLSEPVLEKLKISNCRVYVSFDNLFTITNYKGFNPDIGRGGWILDRGVDFGHVAYPLARTSMLGVQLSF